MHFDRLGPYRVERQLGRGGMGTVYAAVHTETNQRVALKVLAPSLADDEGFRQRFGAEIESLLKLRHPNIVEIYAYGEQNGNLFYAMELIAGKNLFEEQQTGKRFAWQEVTRIGIEICKALKHAHDHGVVHRDLKPANLLIDPTGAVKLTDFGIAKLFGATHLTSHGGVLGTADYMSPEQAEGKAVGPRTDLYSLGGVLFSLLTGRPPFVGKSLPEVLHMLRFSEPTPVRRLAPETPEALEQIILELLDKDPQLRIPTAIALGRRLESMLHGLTQTPREPAPSSSPSPANAVHTGDTKISTPEDEGDFSVSEQVTEVTDQSKTENTPVSAGPPPNATIDPGLELAPLEPQATAHGMPKTDFGASALTSGAAPVAEGEATRQMRFTVVDEEERRRAGHLDVSEEAPPAWPRIAGGIVVLLVLLLITGYALTPPSADAMYARLRKLAEDDDPAHMVTAEDELHAFLEKYPDDERAAELQGYLEEIELYRMQRRFERQARRASAADALTPAERAYLEATQLIAHQPEQAAVKMRAIVEVFELDPKATDVTKNCVKLARRQAQQLEEANRRAESQQKVAIEQQLAQAERLSLEAPEMAAAIWRGIVELYGHKPWAADLVSRARASLARTAAATEAEERPVNRGPAPPL